MTRKRKDLGDWGETQACNFLIRQGFVVVDRNYHTTMGEVDIVATKGDDYYFVEVKTRKDSELAHDDSITYSKKIRLQKAIRAYCYIHSIADKAIIMAGLIITLKRAESTASFRFYVIN